MEDPAANQKKKPPVKGIIAKLPCLKKKTAKKDPNDKDVTVFQLVRILFFRFFQKF
jgi:hypothetical protein